MTTTLYRHYDSAGQLLYVGIADDVRARFRVHMSATWWEDMARFTLEDFPTRASAVDAERKAIATERPLYNIAGGPAPYPGSVIPMPTGGKRILITGSRKFTDLTIIEAALLAEGPGTVVHGCADGTDQLAHQIAMKYRIQGYTVEPHPAKWRALGDGAGRIRDEELVALGADVCLAFFKTGAANRGTRDCVGRATSAGIPVKEFWR